LKTLLRQVAILPILFYRYVISPFTPAACRFQPTCSSYAVDAVTRHGVVRGGGLMLRRLARCHPWGGQGYDPVPSHAPPATSNGIPNEPLGR